MKKFLLALVFVALAPPVSAGSVCVEFADILSEVAVARDMDIPMSHMARVVVKGMGEQMAKQALGLIGTVYDTLEDFTPAEVWGIALKSCMETIK